MMKAPPGHSVSSGKGGNEGPSSPFKQTDSQTEREFWESPGYNEAARKGPVLIERGTQGRQIPFLETSRKGDEGTSRRAKTIHQRQH